MTSTIGIDELINRTMDEFIANHSYVMGGGYCTCQDTEDNNETEVYVYIPVEHKRNVILLTSLISSHLGLPEDYTPSYEDENDGGHKGLIRLGYVVTICHSTGDKAAFA